MFGTSCLSFLYILQFHEQIQFDDTLCIGYNKEDLLLNLYHNWKVYCIMKIKIMVE